MAEQPPSALPDRPKPQLVRLLEAVAAIMDLDVGEQRLELIFDNGHLRRWYTHRERNGAQTLVEYDDRAAHLVAGLGLG